MVHCLAGRNWFTLERIRTGHGINTPALTMTRVVITRSRSKNPSTNRLADALSRGGYHVTLLRWNRLREDYPDSKSTYVVDEFRLGAPYDQPSVVFLLPFWIAYVFVYLLRHDCEVMHPCDLDTLVPALLASRIRKVRLCYTMFDFYADNLPEKAPPLLRRLVALVEKRGIESTDLLLLVNESQLEQIKGTRFNRVAYVYNAPEDSDPGVVRQTSGDRITLFYAGIIHKARGLENIVRAAQETPGVRLVIAGSGPYAPSLMTILSTAEGNVEFLGWIPHEAVIEKTKEADAVIALYDPRVRSNKYASPNKLFEAMMCRRPIVTNSGITAARIVQEERCGLVVPYGDKEALKSVLLALLKSPELRLELGESGRRAYETKYSWG